MIKDNQKVKLELIIMDNGFYKIIIERDSFIEALKVICDNLEDQIYCSIDFSTGSSIVSSLENLSDGNAHPVVLILRDLISGETIINNIYDEPDVVYNW